MTAGFTWNGPIFNEAEGPTSFVELRRFTWEIKISQFEIVVCRSNIVTRPLSLTARSHCFDLLQLFIARTIDMPL